MTTAQSSAPTSPQGFLACREAVIYDTIKGYEDGVMDYLEWNPYLEIWSSIGAARLLRRKKVVATRKGLTLVRKPKR
jgi:hypothetical protein